MASWQAQKELLGDEDEEDGHGPELTGAHLPSLLTGTATAPSHVRSAQSPAPQLVPLTDLLGLLLATRSELRPWLWAPGGSLGCFWPGWWHFLAPLQSRITTHTAVSGIITLGNMVFTRLSHLF